MPDDAGCALLLLDSPMRCRVNDYNVFVLINKEELLMTLMLLS
jgi:hypothetical protein